MAASYVFDLLDKSHARAAFHRAFRNEIASCMILVDALDEGAAGFYEKHSFRRFPDRPLRLYITMEAVEKPIISLGLVTAVP